MPIDSATLAIQFLALYEAGENAIYWENETAPYAGECGYNRLILGLPPSKRVASYIQIEPSQTRVEKYDRNNRRHHRFLCYGCVGERENSGDETPSRVKYHFEPFPGDDDGNQQN